jgi:peptidoglycan/xylan/chitin deacetylase (PgdA/CDA1 family)
MTPGPSLRRTQTCRACPLLKSLSEWTQTSAAIVAAGAPQPTLWRPPYGDTTDHYDYLASTLGLRLVMSWSNNGTIVDSRDTEGLTASQIASTVIAGLHGGVIIAMHDGDNNSSSTIASLPGIVSYMNANNLCATGTVPADATGGDGYINYGG